CRPDERGASGDKGGVTRRDGSPSNATAMLHGGGLPAYGHDATGGLRSVDDHAGVSMHCPFCRHPDSRVVDSRTADDGLSIRRRRQCPNCNRRVRPVATASLSVVKRSGAPDPFSRDKVVAGVRKACQGRPVSDDDLAILAQRVEETLRSTGSAEIDAYEVGLAILGPLRELDEVAYLRFASVYQSFDSLEDFESAITSLRAERAERTAAQAWAAPRHRRRGRQCAPACDDVAPGARHALAPARSVVQAGVGRRTRARDPRNRRRGSVCRTTSSPRRHRPTRIVP